ncbi:protein of unknown function [Legionella fallonii LLAP-10]|uniref:Uncharacterized protein n=1 Tax=Legionella fallonii LLAP-10 TaxID=1212491 RepID=A0A098G0R6_9GAMM|nr:protein of unknown function [Legionella fallonii LLAP-10]
MLKYLHHFCLMIHPTESSYDDFIPKNTPLHQAILEQDGRKLELTLSTFVTPQLLTYASCKNTALLLACKVADKKALKTRSGKICDYFYHHQLTLRDFRIIGSLLRISSN